MGAPGGYSRGLYGLLLVAIWAPGPKLRKWLLQGSGFVAGNLGEHVSMCHVCTWAHCLLLCGGALDTAIGHLDTRIAGGGAGR